MIGSVEHTRNGFNRLAEVEAAFDRLAFPAFSIAISSLKLDVEAKEVAVSIINAIENVLHATGRILNRRSCLVLGSKGAIGGRIVGVLLNRLDVPREQLWGVDLKASEGREGEPQELIEAPTYQELTDQRRLQTDLVIGVTGQSILTGEDLTEWLLNKYPNYGNE